MTAILTGDIINSRRLPSVEWVTDLKQLFSTIGKTSKTWEIYRGDEFQVEIAATDAVLFTIHLKAFLKARKLDARISIGLGEKDYAADKITESNGSAFIRSGELFDTLRKEKLTIAINSGNADFDSDLNLLLRFGSAIINNWLPQSGEFVQKAIENQALSQEELGVLLGISQAAVSRRQKRSQFELIMELDAYYRNKLKMLTK